MSGDPQSAVVGRRVWVPLGVLAVAAVALLVLAHLRWAPVAVGLALFPAALWLRRRSGCSDGECPPAWPRCSSSSACSAPWR